MRKKALRVKSRNDQELRAIALGVHEGRIITNAQVHECHWRQYAIAQPRLALQFVKVTRTDVVKLKGFGEEIEAWERGVLKPPRSHLKS